MKRLLCFLLLVIASSSLHSQTIETKETVHNKSTPLYQLFPTHNMWTFIKLNTSNGQMWRVQYSIKSDDYRFEEPIIGSIGIGLESSIKFPDLELNPGRFTLYSTQNINTFLLLDQQTGRIWQVQYPRDSEQVILIK